jgi:alkylated DNA repair dioxygenase AlkB
LLHQIAAIELRNLNFRGHEEEKKVASFGYDRIFEKRILTKGKQIPKQFEWLLEMMARKTHIGFDRISGFLVTAYPKGSVINWNRDATPFDTIIGVSLLSDCTFKFRPLDQTKQNRKNIISFPVLRKSIYIMRDESRSEWEHSIASVTSQRFSISLRTLK